MITKVQFTNKDIIDILRAVKKAEKRPGLKVIRLAEKRRIEFKKLTRVKAG